MGQTLPQGGSVASGAATISTPAAGQMVVRQSSDRAIVNWNSFSVGQGNRVTFQQPGGQSAVLNRVTGSEGSTIAGQIRANGQVYLVNPNGIEITRTGDIRAQSFVASTLATSDEDFRRGARRFQGNGSSAAVTNAGRIRTRGGDAVLIGGRVENSGTIVTRGGRVGLAAGERVRVDAEGDGFLTVEVPTSDRQATRALINQAGRIRSQGGRVELRAATTADMARAAIRISGAIDASSVSRGRGGAVTFGGGGSGGGGATSRPARPVRVARPQEPRPPRGAGTVVVDGGRGGTTAVTGRITARGGNTTNGGSVTITSRDIQLTGAAIDVSGRSGGSVRIGGEYQGGAGLPTAQTVTVDSASTITADAAAGTGGRVIVWSDLDTAFGGRISARGAGDGGNGGFAEVSGKARLAYTGFVDLSAPMGSIGTLLLDPYNLTISTSVSSGMSGFDASADNSVLNATTLLNQLATANVTVTTGSAGTQSGDITVAAPLSWTAATTLTLNAARNITVNAPISFGGTAGAGLTLTAGQALQVNSNITVNGAGAVSLATGNRAILNASGGTAATVEDYAFGGGASLSFGGAATSQSLTINSNAYTLLHDMADVQGINATNSGRYALAAPLDAGGTTYTGALAGTGTVFTGTLTGLGNTISNLTISTSSANAGLFGTIGTGTVRDIGLIGGSVTSSASTPKV